jgi:prepilin-type N-terminal cleavage/methylation domain-containing protein
MLDGAADDLDAEDMNGRRVGHHSSVPRLLPPAFSLPELLVAVGIIALLIAILLPALQLARRHAMEARCSAQQQQIGVSLETIKSEYRFYPLWDDDASPTRFTWIDVLVQRKHMASSRVGYCPEDRRPDPINEARGVQYKVRYPLQPDRFGSDYSYGISVPLSAGAWAWRSAYSINGDTRPRRLTEYEQYPSRRVLAADATWSTVYNLSGDALQTGDWSKPTQYDNMVGYRHIDRVARLLMQDGHVGSVRYSLDAEKPLNTSQQYVWHAGESMNVNPEDSYMGNYYPNAPSFLSDTSNDGIPRDLIPSYYTRNDLWTRIEHK